MQRFLPLFAAAVLAAGCADSDPPQGALGEGWLLGEESEQARFEQLQGYLGGFSSAMWETGYRFAQVHDAVLEENYPLASYHWGKVRSAIENGYLKRPARRENAEALFLDGPWGELEQALGNGEPAQVRSAFNQARQACMACHVAEKVPFMNGMAVLRDSAL